MTLTEAAPVALPRLGRARMDATVRVGAAALPPQHLHVESFRW